MGHFKEYYITEIKIDKLRHLSEFTIELNDKKRTNLLLTGKNGAGKTTLLNAVKKYLRAINMNNLFNIEQYYPSLRDQALTKIENSKTVDERFRAEGEYQTYLEAIEEYKQGIAVAFNETDGIEGAYQKGEFITAFYGVDRKVGMKKQNGVEEVVLEDKYPLDSNPGTILLKYLVHLKTQQAYARNEGDVDTLNMLEMWLNN